MEKRIVKSVVYVFISCFALLFAFTSQDPIVTMSDGSYTTVHMDTADYLMKITRTSIKVTLAAALLVTAIEIYKRIRPRS
ncbi:hypothetical protein HNQ34_003016 [Anoxybacillus tepidamans]|uniref:Uncharacterized protein n=1 Tax=Anoxybacteroides tepidamans TaxID=265948 RepID=A0A7W8ISG1_9BACL|nr:hypothetical protein [Anoxybacillus tepidamans]MBB5325910.1 hypothetical protein [Anoxybacillus tepidamans]